MHASLTRSFSQKTVISSAIAILLLAACGRGSNSDDSASASSDPPQNQSDDGIVGGRKVTERDRAARSVVALVSRQNEGQALCTGTIYNESTILTAAHCVDHDPEELLIVFAKQLPGESAKAAPEISIERVRHADSFAQHPKWHKSETPGEGDLALIHFPGGLPADAAPVALADQKIELKTGTPVLLVGYGVTSGLEKKGAGTLRSTESKVNAILSPSQVLTDGRARGVCFGDSGGPAFIRNAKAFIQWGIASSVTRESCDEESIHTDVRPYRKWISKIAKTLAQKAAPGDGNIQLDDPDVN